MEFVEIQLVTIKGYRTFVSICEQFGKPVLYAVVDTNSSNATTLEVAQLATGQDSSFVTKQKNWEYKTTLNYRDGEAMYHYFVRKR